MGRGESAMGGRRLTSLAQQEAVKMAQPFQARVLGGHVRVLAQDPQHAHQLPHPFEVVLWLWGEARGTTDGRTHPRSPHPATCSAQHVGVGMGPLEVCGRAGTGIWAKFKGWPKNSEIKRNNIFM